MRGNFEYWEQISHKKQKNKKQTHNLSQSKPTKTAHPDIKEDIYFAKGQYHLLLTNQTRKTWL